MFIVPLFPALFANRLHADQTYHLRGSLCLLSPLWTHFSSELLSVAVAYSTVSRCYQSKIHPHIGTLVRRHLRSAFVLYSNLWLLWCSMCDSSSQAILAKETFVAFTRYHFFGMMLGLAFQLQDQSENHDNQNFYCRTPFTALVPFLLSIGCTQSHTWHE